MSIEAIYTILLKLLPLKFVRYHYFRVEEFIKKNAGQIDLSEKKILDIGAQDAPFQKYFSSAKYYTQDVCQNSKNSVDYICDINSGIPEIETGSFDYILCTQVLEHIQKPHIAFMEFHRILKPGGRLFLTTHLCFEEHMIPYDYFRFTRYGLKALGTDAGLELVHIAPHGGIFHLLALIIATLPIKLFIKRDTIIYYIYLAFFSIPILCLNIICSVLDPLDREKTMTLNYECIFEKQK